MHSVTIIPAVRAFSIGSGPISGRGCPSHRIQRHIVRITPYTLLVHMGNMGFANTILKTRPVARTSTREESVH